jgi:hypothetical protein
MILRALFAGLAAATDSILNGMRDRDRKRRLRESKWFCPECDDVIRPGEDHYMGCMLRYYPDDDS